MVLCISFAILNIRRHLELDKKLFFCKICPTKNRMQKCSKLIVLWSKNQIFSHFENHRHFCNLWKELSKVFYCFLSSYFYTKSGKNTLFEMASDLKFLFKSDRTKILLPKSLFSQSCRLQARF
jgi:hypothetical protein